MPSVLEAHARADEDVVDVLLQDSEWVDAEFAAVMAASGFRVASGPVVALRAPVPDGDLIAGAGVVGAPRADRVVAERAEARTRSPPAR